MTLRRIYFLGSVALLVVSCRERSQAASGPTEYVWPDSFSYLVELVAESRADTVVVVRYEERKAIRFAARDDRFLVWYDSVTKVSLAPGRPPEFHPYAPEDTLQYYVGLGRRGEFSDAEPGCDPALADCREVLPSMLPMELRRLVPRLPQWEPPRGYAWEDTLVFDDRRSARGQRGSVVTTYRVVGDTVVATSGLWVVAWRSLRRSYSTAAGPGGLAPGVPVEERGTVYLDKTRRMPVFAMWAGGAAAPENLRSLGVTGTGYRGRAYLAGSVIEQVLSPE